MIFDITIEHNYLEITEDTEINETIVLKNNEDIKTKLEIIHNHPNLKSRINIKVAIFDQAKFDLEILLKIQKGAIGTDTYLKIDCLKIGEKAFARAVPSLEIKESEVKAGHGATIGYLDDQMIYYIKSRGLEEKETENLLVNAFLNNYENS